MFLRVQAVKATSEFQDLLKQAESAVPAEVEEVAQKLQALLRGTPVKPDYLTEIGARPALAGFTVQH